jgi:hypothetical protein
MQYYLNLFSPATWEAYLRSDRTVSGFKPRQLGLARRIVPGDRFLCYMTKLSRWCGLLDISDGPFESDTPIFAEENDPYTVRFHVRPTLILPVDRAIPDPRGKDLGSLLLDGRASSNGHDVGRSFPRKSGIDS